MNIESDLPSVEGNIEVKKEVISIAGVQKFDQLYAVLARKDGADQETGLFDNAQVIRDIDKIREAFSAGKRIEWRNLKDIPDMEGTLHEKIMELLTKENQN